MKPIKKQTWNNIDVFSLYAGNAIWDENYRTLYYTRKPFETPLDVKNNIFKNYDNPSDSSKQGLINALCNEFEVVPYNTESKTVFELTYNPIPSGYQYQQDISGFYMSSSGIWETLGNQIWSENYFKAKKDKTGFIVWQNDRFSNVQGYKNFSYSNTVEVITSLPDKTQLKFEYYINSVDEYNNYSLTRFTDINNFQDPNDDRFLYRKPYHTNLSTDIIAYNLNDIPSGLTYLYYDKNNYPTEFLYGLHRYIDIKFNHKWNTITNKSCIWDIDKNYGSGHIPSFYDAIAPTNKFNSIINYTGLGGGVEPLSYSLYSSKFLAISGNNYDNWYLNIYPGKFYIDGIPFYFFQNKQVSQLTLTKLYSGTYSGYLYSNVPSGFSRGMYSIAANSGYYDTYYCNFERDNYLSGIYEDYDYAKSIDGNCYWTNIYQKKPFYTSYTGPKTYLDFGQYTIDYTSGIIYFNIPDSYNKVTFIWDNIITPTGSYLCYDLNPINEQNINLDKFFMYLSLTANGFYSQSIRP